MKLVCISDTHEQIQNSELKIPEGDVLIHSGDITMGGSLESLGTFLTWAKKAPVKHKLLISGNHDFCFEDRHKRSVEDNKRKKTAVSMVEDAGFVYLQDSRVEIDGVNFWGAPWQPWFHDWAFNLERGREIAEKWELIPDDTNVLITHGPPYKIADMTKHGVHAGCEDLLERISELKKLKVHVFGHIHEGYGVTEKNGIKFVNASTCSIKYLPLNEPIVIEI